MKNERPTVAIVGATGAVGMEFLSILDQRRFPIGELRLLASARSAGKSLRMGDTRHQVTQLSPVSFEGVDLALFSAGGSVSKEYAPIAARKGALVVDNSSAFRLDPAVPLIIPEVNAADLHSSISPSGPGIIANPNCSTIILLVAVEPLRRACGIQRIVVSTAQAVSGAGAAAMEELAQQTRDVLAGHKPVPRLFPEPCAFNIFSHNSKMDPITGRNIEEQKMVDETRKIWRDPSARIAATCIRVPVMRAHAESITLTLKSPIDEPSLRALLRDAPGLRIVDDRAANKFPTPLDASGLDEILIGRIRPDDTQPAEGNRYTGWQLFVCGDQLRKGAALNAIQIAEAAIRQR